MFVCGQVMALVQDFSLLFVVLGKEPTFDTPLANASAELGGTALLPCAIDYLGKYKVDSFFHSFASLNKPTYSALGASVNSA